MTGATRITTPFGRGTTAQDVLRGVDLTGERAVVTGSASGVGRETARVLAAAGAGAERLSPNATSKQAKA